MLCGKCGANIEEGSAFCPICGNRIGELSKKKSQKKLWILLGSIGGTVIISAIIIVVILVCFSYRKKEEFQKLYVCEDFSLSYGNNWYDKSKDDQMNLIFNEDEDTYLGIVGISSLHEEGYYMKNEEDREDLYDEFEELWKEGLVYDISDDLGYFEKIDNGDLYYTWMDYSINIGDKENMGKLYVVASDERDVIISFIYVTDNQEYTETIEEDIYAMLLTLDIENQSNTTGSNTFDGTTGTFAPGNVSDYSVLGYIDYEVPECWVYDEEKSATAGYDNNIFMYKDKASMFYVKASSLYQPTSYEAMEQQVISTFDSVETKEFVSFQDRQWCHMTTAPYYSEEYGFYQDEIYIYISEDGYDMYYFDFAISSDLYGEERTYVLDSINYILESSELY